MHLKRWITGLVALPLLILLISKGGPFLFACVVGLVCILALWEYFRIVMQSKSRSDPWFITTTGYITGTVIIWTAYINSFELVLGLIVLNFLACTLIALPQFKSDSSVTEIVFKQILGTIYIPLLLSYLIMIRNGLDGVIWIYFLLIVVFAG
ncbi:phosphatidate cytidylyltransferase, partial [Thermodesulfobacteriota bacterium]